MSEDALHLRRHGAALPPALIDPHPDRAPGPGREQILDAHRQAVADGADGYVDPVSGLFCFTAAYHWDKGQCCALGCRHCPWVDAGNRLRR